LEIETKPTHKKCATNSNWREAGVYGRVKHHNMKTRLMLLITNDDGLEDLAAKALSEIGGVSHLTSDPSDALEAVCGTPDLDAVLIDIDQGPHLITLLNAIKTCRQDLHAIAITRDNDKHLKALAYANGAVACFPKPISAVRLAAALCKLQRLSPGLIAA
jgi:CheY-like chemotaxis protein